jgi:putative oxidoreductase
VKATLTRLMRNVWLQRLVALIVGAVFVYASHDKIWWPEKFARIVYHYQVIGPNDLFPPLLPNLLAVLLPWIELLAGLALIVGLWRREAALLTAVLLAVFIVAVASTLIRGIDIENCGCFSLDAHGRSAGLKLIVQDLALLVGALLLVCLPPASAPDARTPAAAPALDKPGAGS